MTQKRKKVQIASRTDSRKLLKKEKFCTLFRLSAKWFQQSRARPGAVRRRRMLHITAMRLQLRDASQPSLNPQATEFIPTAQSGTTAAAGASLEANHPPRSSSNTAFVGGADGLVGTSTDSRHNNAAHGGRHAGRPNGEAHGRRSRQRGERQGPERRARRRRTRTQNGDNVSAATATTATGEPTHRSELERPRQGRHGRRSVSERSPGGSMEPPSIVSRSQDSRRFTLRWVNSALRCTFQT